MKNINIIEEQLISFETAKLAKEKGFDIQGDHKCYIPNGQLFPSSYSVSNYDAAVAREFTKTVPAPTQSLLQKWLFEKHNIWVNIQHGTLNEALEEEMKFALNLI